MDVQLVLDDRRVMAIPLPSLRARLDKAHSYASLGSHRSAREACAAVMLDELPAVAKDHRLLLRLVEVLVLAQGFQQLARLLRAVEGVQVAFLPGQADLANDTPGLLCEKADGDFTVMFDAGALRRPNAAETARRWSRDILRAVIG